MTLYTITVGNIYIEETETVQDLSQDQAEHEAKEAANKMLADLKNHFKGSDIYDPARMTIEDDITFTRTEVDAYEYSQDN